VWAKEAIFPEDRFPGAADRAAEMRSTGEVMAGGDSVSEAYARALRAAGRSLPRVGPAPPSLQELAAVRV
jgi:carbamoylphosphate synthase large subunit